MPNNLNADETREMMFTLKISRHDTDRVVRAERRVREADASSVLAPLYAATNYSDFAIGAGLEELAMPRVDPAYQHRTSSGVN
jgi:hypothetical protein